MNETLITHSGIEEIQFNKIYDYIKFFKNKYDLKISILKLTKIIISDILIENISTNTLNIETAKLCVSLSYYDNYDYYLLAGYIYCDNLHKKFNIKDINELYSIIHNNNQNLFNESFLLFIRKNKEELNNILKFENDYLIDYFGLQTLSKGYLISLNDISERPQHMLLRVAIQIHYLSDLSEKEKLENIKNTYNLLSSKKYTHATPTLFNSGLKRNQLSSCFLLGNLEDSIDSIYGKCLRDSALISKNSGGIGIALHSIRSKNSYIKGTNGYSNGIIPMMKVFDATARYCDQGGGKRNGSIAFFLEPWHADIFDFLEAKRPAGDDSQKARDLFYALWIPDLFMKRLSKNEKWSLFCPNKCPGLDTSYGDEFEKLYEYYESKKMYNKQINISELFYKICDTLIETGTPYILYKDNVNKYSNQKNIGTIRSSNLCCEIMQYSDVNETSVCNLASINLMSFITSSNEYDYEELRKVAYEATINLNNIIDVTYYPTKTAQNSNLKNRPIGLGVQGFANVLYKLKYPIDSIDAKLLNDNIFETIYYGSLQASVDLAKKYGYYERFPDSPFSQGKFQFDLLNKNVSEIQNSEIKKKNLWDWNLLREQMIKYGTRNSQLTAIMPTASTSQILGNYESIEIPQTNIFVRSTKAGKFPVINKFLVEDLLKLGIWNENLQKKIIHYKGNLEEIDDIPIKIKHLYKSIWDIPQKHIIDLSIDRQKYVDQSQSLNIYYDPSMTKNMYNKLLSVMMYGWSNKLKTGIYYLRTKPASHALNFADGGYDPNVCHSCSA